MFFFVPWSQGGEISKALELCFQHHQFEVLHQIADDLSEDSSSEMTRRVADYFMENDQFDKAVELLVKSRQVDSALDLCLSHHIRLTEEMVETMTPVKREGGECVSVGVWVCTCMCVCVI